MLMKPEQALVSDLGLGGRAQRRIVELLQLMQLPATVDALCSLSEKDLLALPGFGRDSLAKVVSALSEVGRSLGSPLGEVAVIAPPAWNPRPRIWASLLQSAAICPGSAFLAQRARDLQINTSTEYAEIGKLGHKWLEQRFFGQPVVDGLPLDVLASLTEFWEWLSEGTSLPGYVFDPPPPDLDPREPVSFDADLTVWMELPVVASFGEVVASGRTDLMMMRGRHAWIADWKFYNDPSQLPKISDDLQMYAYAVAVAQEYAVESVSIRRYLVYHNRVDALELDSQLLAMAYEAVEEVARGIWNARESLKPGAHCRRCFQRVHCQEFAEQGKALDTREMGPYMGGAFAREVDALRFLLAVPAIETRIAQGLAAAKEYVRSRRAVTDLTSGKIWGPRETLRTEVDDVVGALGLLAQRLSQAEALNAAKTSKAAIERALKAAGVKPVERRAFFDELFRLNLCKRRPAERWEWRKP